MKNIVLFFAFLISFLTTKITPVSAHSADVAYLDLYVYHDRNNQPLANTSALGIISISWVQMSWLAKEYLNSELPASEQIIPAKAYTPYFMDKLVIKNDAEACILTYGSILKTKDSDIVFGKGLPIPITITCTKPIHKLSVTSTMFLEQFPLHTTILSVLTGNDTNITTTVLTKNYQTFSFIPTKPHPKEVTMSTGIAGLPSFPQVTKSIAEQFLKHGKTSLPLALFFVFFLGMLHTLEAGHSKTILASYVLNKRISMPRALSFAGIFTFTHLADILILGIFFLITNSFIDLYSKLSLLNVVALYMLLFISIYMIFKSTGQFIRHKWHPISAHPHSPDESHTHEHSSDHSHPWNAYPNDFKKQLFMAFLIGLSPCIFGWSIFMVIVSMKQVWTVIPILLFFGLGIFSALALVVFLLTKIKRKLADKYAWIGEFSPIVSYILLALFAGISLLR